MSSPTRKGVATKELLRQVVSRSTGRMSLDTVDGRLEVYLMNGDLIGAVSPNDDASLLRRVRIEDAVAPDRLASLTRMAASKQSLFGPLIDIVPTEIIEPALADRFRENIVQWVSQSEEPVFESLPGVFVDNMQMGHNTVQLIESCCTLADLATSYPLDTEVVRGTGKPIDHLEALIQSSTSNLPVSIASLLANLPAEPFTARATLARMLDTGLLLEGGLELQELYTDEVELLRDGPLNPADDEDDEDAPTVRAVNELLDLETSETSSSSSISPVSPNGDLSSWLHTGDLDDEDMAFFEDDELDRGGGEGAFTTQTHNLDKVEVTDSPEEIIEVGEAPATRFAAPVLGEDVAEQKIAVCNDVLMKVSAAFDKVEGAGRGQAVVQLLMDGAPSKFTAILHNLSVTSQGEIPVDEVLDNLARRPASEHRQLLNSALKDVMERALSSAADELPDEPFDELYESVAGYNQRLGL